MIFYNLIFVLAKSTYSSRLQKQNESLQTMQTLTDIMGALVLIAFIALLLTVLYCAVCKPNVLKDIFASWFREPDSKEEVGKKGEVQATNLIRSILREGDHHFTNVNIVDPNGRKTELDNLIVNRYGLFIVEVKNYRGRITGTWGEEDWVKYSTSSGGNVYSKEVRNPFLQADRSAGILGRMIRNQCGVQIYANPYVYFVQDNSPYLATNLLRTGKDIDSAIHPGGKAKLNSKQIEDILYVIGLFV